MAEPRSLTGLLLGAGASYEAGMPLAAELTAELTDWLTPGKLQELNQSWRLQGGGYPDQVIDDFVSMLSRADQHYESLLGYLEVQFRRHSPLSQHYHGLYSWLVDMVYHLLYFRHTKNVDYIQRNLAFYDGVSALAEQNKPLWIFSLNHDTIVECLAVRQDIPLSSGFTDEVVTLPRRNHRGAIIGHLSAAVLPGDQLESSAMSFFRDGTYGLNLLKLHGGLDIFTFRDGKDLLKILPLGEEVDGPLHALRAANEDLRYWPPSPVRATNEIVYADHTGEMQFLRRSLLAGAFKFDPRHTQVLPPRLLEHFRSYINCVRTLVCIGYGFGDDHINKIAREWLDFSQERRLVIVAPDAISIPPTLLHVAAQVDLHSVSATNYLDSYAGVVRSKRETTEKELTAWIRRNGKTAIDDLLSFSRARQTEKFAEWIQRLPMRDGDIDVDALPVPFDELVQEARKLISTPEEIIEEFLKTRDLR